MNLLEITLWPTTGVELIAFLFSAVVVGYSVYLGIHKMFDVATQKVQRDIEIAKTKQFSGEQIVKFLDKVHDVENKMTHIQEASKEHKTQIKEMISEMKDDIKILATDLKDLLKGTKLK